MTQEQKNYVAKYLASGDIVIEAKITYTVDNEHPDYACMTPKQRKGKNTYGDIYIYSHNYYSGVNAGMLEHIKEDLLLIAGGGYNNEHVHNPKVTIKKIVTVGSDGRFVYRKVSR